MTRRPSAALAALAVLFAVARLGAEEGATARMRVAFEPPGTSFADALEKAGAAGRPLYVEVGSERCELCRVLEEHVYTREDVAEVLAAFVCLRIDGERGAGREVARRYRVDEFPTLLVLAPDGAEIDRIGDPRKPPALQEELRRTARGERTLPALRAAVDADPAQAGPTLALAAKLVAGAPEEALARLDALDAALAARGAPPPRETSAEILLTKAIAADALDREDLARDLFERVVREMPDTEAGRRAAIAGIPAFVDAPPRRALPFLWTAEARLPEGGVRDYVTSRIERLLGEETEATLRRRAERGADDAEVLNDVAWTCFERRVLLEEATAWAQRAVELSGRKPHVLDTLANLRFHAREMDEAIRLEEEALAGAKDGTARADFEETLVVFRALRAHRTR
jgi:tetratricopeptide (TPR) repeat protein